MLTSEIAIATEQIAFTETDPVLANAALPLRALYHPLGFPLEVYTNSPVVLAAAQQSWGHFQSKFSCSPLILRIGVTEDTPSSPDILPPPVCRVQENLLSNIVDAHNFVVCDLNAGFSFGWITERTAASTLYLRYHILEAAALCMIAALRAAPLHAACVVPLGHGMLLCGDSGAGKSSLAFAGARSGWTFISDDASYLPFARKDRMVVGNCHQVRLRDTAALLFPELEGRAVTPRAAGKPSIELPTADLPGLLTADSAIVQSIIFLNRRDAEDPGLFSFSRKTALSWFNQFSLAPATTYQAQMAAIRHLLDVEIFELRYTDLNWAIERLETLARTGR